MLRQRLASLAIALSLVTNAASAAGVVVYSKHERPDPRDVASILTGSPQMPEGLKMRSIRLLPAEPEQKLPQPARTEAGPFDYAAVPSDTPVPLPAIASTVVAAPKAAEPAPAADRTPTSFALQVQFAFDSSRIMSSAYDQVDAVAAGIKLAGPKIRVVIEGHTDSIGSDEYNLKLSSQRAEAVRRYLITEHGIAPSQLRVVGMGKYAPLNKAEPTAPENRRVEFRAET
jgi:outer membrane protein OmpA-like peptidoglycan-associated protein